MDSRTRLDQAVFHLTPTRTRCDLVIFGNGLNEKLATGLLEPFVLHLKSAKEQIPKGGYSITLSPPSSSASWFTKGTLQRFVRFVSTPEVLERFVTIEREILQIENSVQSSELLNSAAETTGNESSAEGINKLSSASSKPNGESNGTSDGVPEENSKVRLHRVLETRMAVLRKEQAMAYARALVAGFESDHLDQLIAFADFFGASRLREACFEFMELCKQKNGDRLWIDEVAAMQAAALPQFPYVGTSGIVLAGEDNDPSQSSPIDASVSDSSASHTSLDNNHAQMDGKSQAPVSWANHLPPYMQNFQGPMYQQQIPPYQGYPFPGMPLAGPYYPGNMNWSPNIEDFGPAHNHESHSRRSHKSSRNKEKYSHENGSDASDQDGYSDSDHSSDGDKISSSKGKVQKKQQGRKSSRKVVIRNINYITSRDGERSGSEESFDDEFIDGDTLKQQVEEAVESLGRHNKTASRYHRKQEGTKDAVHIKGSEAVDQDIGAHVTSSEGGKKNGGWDAFQNLLLRDQESDFSAVHPVNNLEEYSSIKGYEEKTASLLNLEAETVPKQRAISTDSFIVAGRDPIDEGNIHIERVEAGEDFRPIVRKTDNTYEEMLFSQRREDSRNHYRDMASESITNSSVIKTQSEGDWFTNNQMSKSGDKIESADLKIFDGDYASSTNRGNLQTEKNKKEVYVDDSFMIQALPVIEDQSRTDISMMSDIVGSIQLENGAPEISREKAKAFNSHEPDDLYMMLDRDSAVENPMASWTPEMDYESVAPLKPADNVQPEEEVSKESGKLSTRDKISQKKTNGVLNTRVSSRDIRSQALRGTLGKSKSENKSRIKKPATIDKSKQEEERRKRMEELLIQRQKRIAERSGDNGTSPSTDNKKGTTSVKNEKPKIKSVVHENKKSFIRSSTINSLATPRQVSSTQSPASQYKKQNSKVSGASQKIAGSDNKKLSLNKIKPSVQKIDQKDPNLLPSTLDVQRNSSPASIEVTSSHLEAVSVISGKEEVELQGRAVFEEKEETQREISAELEQILGREDSSVPIEKSTLPLDNIKSESRGLSEASPFLYENARVTDEKIEIVPESNSGKVLINIAPSTDENGVADEGFIPSTEISEVEISTPPMTNGISPDPYHSRKKWDNGEASPKANKGLRKLLFFGRKSRNSATN